MTCYLNVKPDRRLLDPNFQSYRLSLDTLPILKTNLTDENEQFELPDDKFGYLHAQLSSSINRLFSDDVAVFHVERNGQIKFNKLNSVDRFCEQRIVWQLPAELPGDVTICFPHPDWSIVCDSSHVYLLQTLSRSEGEPWSLRHTHEADAGSVLLHSTHREFPPARRLIDVLTLRVDKSSNHQLVGGGEDKPHFVCCLDWVTLSAILDCDTRWSVKRTRRLIGPSLPAYAAIESNCVVIAAEKEFKFYSDSDKSECEFESAPSIKPPLQSPIYTFMQSQEDVRVNFKLPDGIIKDDLNVVVATDKIEVKVKGEVAFSGNTYGKLDERNCVWTVQECKLELLLSKQSPCWWKQLIVGDDRGEEVMDTETVARIHSLLAHLTSDTPVIDATCNQSAYDPQQLEDCDDSMEQFQLQRIDSETRAITHQANLAGYQWMYKTTSTTLLDNCLPAFCTRYDVDGIVWQPTLNDQFELWHVATHSALGYVLASKVDRKFVVAPPDFSYCAVCDAIRHVYIYRQPEALHGELELRNRKTGVEVDRIAKQHVVSLEQCDRILGMHATNKCVFVLATKAIYAIRV